VPERLLTESGVGYRLVTSGTETGDGAQP
jgi:hypothetical protein